MVKILNEITSKYYIQYQDKETGVLKEKIVPFDTGNKDFRKAMEMINQTQDKNSDPDEIAIKWGSVSDDTPLGFLGNAKILKIRQGKRGHQDAKIYFKTENGVIRFQDFHKIVVQNAEIVKDSTEDGDLLKVVFPEGLTLLDVTETNNLRYLLRSVQLLNEQFLMESDNDDENNDNEDDDTNNDNQTTHTVADRQIENSSISDDHKWHPNTYNK